MYHLIPVYQVSVYMDEEKTMKRFAESPIDCPNGKKKTSIKNETESTESSGQTDKVFPVQNEDELSSCETENAEKEKKKISSERYSYDEIPRYSYKIPNVPSSQKKDMITQTEGNVEQQLSSFQEIPQTYRPILMCQQPLLEGRHKDLKMIVPVTLANLICGKIKIDDLLIIDCRYPYEYSNGHIQGAINIFQVEVILNMFFPTKEPLKSPVHNGIVIFYCDYSAVRGPFMYRCVRAMDHVLHTVKTKSERHFSQMYLLQGGYRQFFEYYECYCEPQNFMGICDASYAVELELSRQRFRRNYDIIAGRYLYIAEVKLIPFERSPQMYRLPLISGKHIDLKTISPRTLASLFSGEIKVDEFLIIDCRYPFEYLNGHIKGAINVFEVDEMLNKFFPTGEPLKNPVHSGIIIFHCEFSAVRGPFMYRSVRSKDHMLHMVKTRSGRKYLEMYLLEGGYHTFYEKYQGYCEPQHYVRMRDEKYDEELNLSRERYRKSYENIADRNQYMDFEIV